MTARPIIDVLERARQQKAYWINRKKTVDEIIKTDPPHCEASPENIYNHLSYMFAGSDH